jgi:hypothetical protein
MTMVGNLGEKVIKDENESFQPFIGEDFVSGRRPLSATNEVSRPGKEETKAQEKRKRGLGGFRSQPNLHRLSAWLRLRLHWQNLVRRGTNRNQLFQ